MGKPMKRKPKQREEKKKSNINKRWAHLSSVSARHCRDLITEYVSLYGKENWAFSTYEGNVGLINNYIHPIIGSDTNSQRSIPRFIERYYQGSFEDTCS